MINILHINDKIENRGGVETNIKQICSLAPRYKMQMYWLGFYDEQIGFSIKIASKPEYEFYNENLSNCIEYIKAFCKNLDIDIIHVHSISNPKLLDALFEIKPLVRSMREPRMFCPGQGKFFRKSERICNITYGLHCFYHAYKEGCCNRHPKRLLKAYKNVKYETNIASNKYAAIFVMSNYMREEALKVGFKSHTLVLNPHLTPIINKEQLIDSSNDNTKSLVYVGRLSRTKGVHYAIKSVVALLEKGYKLKFDIVGSGHDEHYFKSLIPDLHKPQFIFHGWQDRQAIDMIIKKAYIVLFPSIYPEAFGISGIEAMMRGKPVVGFDVGGVSTWLKDKHTGFLVDQKNYLEMANKVAILIDDESLYTRLSNNSRDIAENEFSEKKHMNLLKSTYKKIINEIG